MAQVGLATHNSVNCAGRGPGEPSRQEDVPAHLSRASHSHSQALPRTRRPGVQVAAGQCH